jgi:hypothetical protein
MMVLFKKIVFLFVLVAVVLVPLSWIVRRANHQMVCASMFKLPNGTKTLILGDSHLETAINPKDIPNSYSIAKSGENYFYTYNKLIHFLKNKQNIETVIIGCSWHNFSKIYQEPCLFGDKSETMSGYFPLLNNNSKSVIKRWDPNYIVPFLTYDIGLPLGIYKDRFLLAGLMHKQLAISANPFYGGFRDINASNVNDSAIGEKIKLYFGDENLANSQLMVTYLHKVIELCDRNNIEVVLVNSPVHPQFREKVPKFYIEAFNVILTDLRYKYKHLDFIDISDLDLPGDAYYDGDHVNKIGSAIVSRNLMATIGTHRKSNHKNERCSNEYQNRP